jgi:hypothetical protein
MATWPVDLRGVTETVVATLGPNERYNLAALGVHAPDDGPATARTWGRTRTWRNFRERGEGVVQFIPDAVVFTEAALGILEQDGAVHDEADAWVRVSVEALDEGVDGGTQWVDWALTPDESTIRHERPFQFNRGYGAVVEATVAASRLDVAAYDTDTLRSRIDYFEDVVARSGGPREHEAFDRIREYVDTQA